MKLKLKNLAPYLPYKLKMLHYGKEKVLNAGQGSSVYWVGITHALNHQESIKPLLHPLSRLIEPILEGGKIPLHELLRGNCFNVEKIIKEQGVSELNKYEPTFQPPFIDFTDGLKLCEWHIDVFGLIEKGLALPIETSKAKGE